jgi:hypothetical protein
MWHLFCDCESRMNERLEVIEKHLENLGISPYPQWDCSEGFPVRGVSDRFSPRKQSARIDRLCAFLGLEERRIPAASEQIILEKIKGK